MPMEEIVIDSIRARMDAGGFVTLDERPFRAGDAVRIAESPLAGWTGVFGRALNDSERVAILINALNAAESGMILPRVEGSRPRGQKAISYPY